MTKYVALLRGINVGGNKKIPMADLKKLMEKSGYKNVKTLLASGNVIFDASEKDIVKLRGTIEKFLEKHFGFAIPTLLRTHEDVVALVQSAPFKSVAVTDNTRLYATFLSEKSKRTLKLPYKPSKEKFTVLSSTGHEVFSIFEFVPGVDTPKVMEFLEKEYGKNVTTRNWNTVQKLVL